MAERIAWIDAARGAAMVAIVFGHAVDMGPWKVWVYSFHVPLFFILSGMTFHVKGSFRNYCVRKAKRLLVPYLCFGIASIFIFAIAGNFVAGVLGRNDIDTSLALNIIGLAYGNGKNGMMDFNLPLWFLPCMFVVYLLAFPIAKIEERFRGSIAERVTVVVVTLTASAAVTMLDPVPALPLSIENAVVLLPFFYLGTIFGYADWSVSGIWGRLLAGGALTAVGGVAALANAQYGIVDYVATATRFYPLFFIGALFQGCGLLLIISCTRPRRLMPLMGRQTMPILVMHKFPVVLGQILLANVAVFGVPTLSNPVVSLLLSFAAIALCLEVSGFFKSFMPWVFGATNPKCIKERVDITKGGEK